MRCLNYSCYCLQWWQKRSSERRALNIIKKFRDEMTELKTKHVAVIMEVEEPPLDNIERNAEEESDPVAQG